MASLLFETRTFEPAVYISVATALMIAAFAVCWIPVRRVAKGISSDCCARSSSRRLADLRAHESQTGGLRIVHPTSADFFDGS